MKIEAFFMVRKQKKATVYYCSLLYVLFTYSAEVLSVATGAAGSTET